jgi:non-ribosomal peptide synthetase component F
MLLSVLLLLSPSDLKVGVFSQAYQKFILFAHNTLFKHTGPQMSMQGLDMQPINTHQSNSASGTGTGVMNVPLTLTMAEVQGRLVAKWKYDSAAFDGGIIKRMAECFSTLLRSIVYNPDRKLSDLQLLPQEEVAQLERFNDTSGMTSPIDPDITLVHQLVQKMVGLR